MAINKNNKVTSFFEYTLNHPKSNLRYTSWHRFLGDRGSNYLLDGFHSLHADLNQWICMNDPTINKLKWWNYILISIHFEPFHKQSPLHQQAPCPWGQRKQLSAWWFPQLTCWPKSIDLHEWLYDELIFERKNIIVKMKMNI